MEHMFAGGFIEILRVFILWLYISILDNDIIVVVPQSFLSQ